MNKVNLQDDAVMAYSKQQWSCRMINSLLDRFDNILVFDIETTGFDPKKDEMIEIAMLHIVSKHSVPFIEDEFNALIELTPGKNLPANIVNLTGITVEKLLKEGMPKSKICDKLTDKLSYINPLLVAFNAQFDLCFLFYFLNSFGKAGVLKNVKMLDALTIYKDRKPYPHKLSDAVQDYALETENTHRALDDAKTTFALLCAIGKESDDLARYINLFGYNPKYGVSGQKISSVKYMPQKYDSALKLYEV